MKSALVALVAFSGCKHASEWADSDPEVRAMQRSVREAEEAFIAAWGSCDAAVDAIAKNAMRSAPAELTSWPTGPTVCWTPAWGDCHPDVMRHLELASPCGPSTFPAIMPMRVRVKDKASILAEARKNLATLATRMPPAAPVFNALYIQDCHATTASGGAEPGGGVRCEVAVMTLDANHMANALAFGDATGVVQAKDGSGATSEQDLTMMLDAAMKSTLDEAVGKLVGKLH